VMHAWTTVPSGDNTLISSPSKPLLLELSAHQILRRLKIHLVKEIKAVGNLCHWMANLVQSDGAVVGKLTAV
jgi:hypothetical protein